jgi:hypothetical protein
MSVNSEDDDGEAQEIEEGVYDVNIFMTIRVLGHYIPLERII